jgi:hypothetical protein
VPSPDIKIATYHLGLPSATDDEIDALGKAIATGENIGRIGIDVHRSKSREMNMDYNTTINLINRWNSRSLILQAKML